MSRCAGLLVAVVSVATALSGINTAAQSQGAREEAQRHIAAAKQAGIHTALDSNGYLGDRLSDEDLATIDAAHPEPGRKQSLDIS